VKFYFVTLVLLNIQVLKQTREYRFSYSRRDSEAITASILRLVKNSYSWTTLNREVESSYEMLVSVYQYTWRHNRENYDLKKL